MNIYISLTIILFFIGFWGLFIFNKNLINILISLEIIIISINIFLVLSSINIDNYNSLVFILILLCLVACDSCIGLTLIIYYYRLRGSINIDIINLLKGN